MMDLTPFTGLKAFDRAYGVMLENDPHAEGSVDREILTMAKEGWSGGLRWLHGETCDTE